MLWDTLRFGLKKSRSFDSYGLTTSIERVSMFKLDFTKGRLIAIIWFSVTKYSRKPVKPLAVGSS